MSATNSNRNQISGWMPVCAVFAALILFSIAVATLVKNYSAVHDECRWFLRSQDYKMKVLAQRNTATGELKHMEWDGWGFPGAGDTTVYLVFDPADSLAAAAKAHRPGKFNGIPCEVFLVRRLESHWYTVLFYTDENWGSRNTLDCTGSKA